MKKTIALGAVLMLLAVWAASYAVTHRDDEVTVITSNTAKEIDVRNADIAFYERRAAEDTSSALDRSMLAALYLQRARETGDYNDYERAETWAANSLRLRTERNAKTYALLASALLAQHKFVEARDAAAALDSLGGGLPQHRALLGEIELELGNYDAAARLFEPLVTGGRDMPVVSRIARYKDLTGDLAGAHKLLFRALGVARGQHGLPSEQLAWYYFRYADVSFRIGDISEAERSVKAGLKVSPDDYRLLGLRARLAASQGNWQKAIAAGEAATGVMPDPQTLGLISDAYANIGDTIRSNEFAAAMEAATLRQTGSLHRAWGLFILDRRGSHMQRIREIEARIRDEMKTRHDIYAHDLLAWTLHKQGRDVEAREEMVRALAKHTQDAMLYYHFGIIEQSLGRRAEAVRWLRSALELNPHFSYSGALHARRIISEREDDRE